MIPSIGKPSPISVSCLNIADNSYLLAGSGPIARVFELKRPETALLTLDGHTRPITGIESCADSKWLFTCSEDKTVKIWDFRAHGFQVCQKNSSLILTGAINPLNQSEIFIGDLNGYLNCWDLQANKMRPVYCTDNGKGISSVAFGVKDKVAIGTNDGRVFVSTDEDCSSEQSLHPFFPSKQNLEFSCIHSHSNIVTKVKISDQKVYSTSADGTLNVIDLENLQKGDTWKGNKWMWDCAVTRSSVAFVNSDGYLRVVGASPTEIEVDKRGLVSLAVLSKNSC
jgi:target of rapamycin complex subunit LST8